jgi:hypothetical protein
LVAFGVRGDKGAGVMFKAMGALLLERSSLDRCNAVSEFFWYVRVVIVRKNENSRSKDLNKFTNLRSGP